MMNNLHFRYIHIIVSVCHGDFRMEAAMMAHCIWLVGSWEFEFSSVAVVMSL